MGLIIRMTDTEKIKCNCRERLEISEYDSEQGNAQETDICKRKLVALRITGWTILVLLNWKLSENWYWVTENWGLGTWNWETTGGAGRGFQVQRALYINLSNFPTPYPNTICYRD
jgi:hypothetical protein